MSKVTDMWAMFCMCNNLSSVIFGSNSHVYNVISYERIFTMTDVVLTLCENTRESWEILLTNIRNIGSTYEKVPSTEYIECN